MRIGADLLFFLRSLPSTPSSIGDAFDPKLHSQYPHPVVLQTALEYFSSRLMTLLYLCFTLLLSTKMTVGHSAVQCWVPQQFTKSWEEYTEQICWMSPKMQWTQFEPWKSKLDALSVKGEVRDSSHTTVDYYQWMPYYFLIMAALHPLPSFLWRLWVSKEERYLTQIVFRLADIKKESQGARREEMWQELCQYSVHLFPPHRRDISIIRQMTAISNSIRTGLRCRILPLKYVLYKIILIVWFMVQCHVLSKFIQLPRGMFYGLRLLHLQWEFGDLSWSVSGLFPRIVRCDYSIHALGADLKYSIQCSLPMNMLYEKMVTAIWCILWAMLIPLVINLTIFTFRNLLRSYSPSMKGNTTSIQKQKERVKEIMLPRRWGQRYAMDCIRKAILDNQLVYEWWSRCVLIHEEALTPPYNYSMASTLPNKSYEGYPSTPDVV